MAKLCSHWQVCEDADACHCGTLHNEHDRCGCCPYAHNVGFAAYAQRCREVNLREILDFIHNEHIAQGG